MILYCKHCHRIVGEVPSILDVAEFQTPSHECHHVPHNAPFVDEWVVMKPVVQGDKREPK